MKLKFYLRGLGIGIVVTALLMGMAQPGEEGLTDAQIKERAAQLGMVDKGALTLDQKQNLEENREAEASKATEESETMETSKATEESETSKATEESETEEASETTEEAAESEEPSETEEFSESTGVGETEEPKESAEPKEPLETSPEGEGKEQKSILVTIQWGDNSSTVSRKLEEAGVIADAKAYDKYLCDNGYATVIRAGTYEIPIDGTEEKIAGIITGKE